MSSGQSHKLLAKRWPIVFGIGIAAAVIVVTAGHNIHGLGASGVGEVVVEAPSAGPRDRPSRRPVAIAQVAESSAMAGADIDSIAAAINARRSAKRREASVQIAGMREIAAARYAKERQDPAWASAQAGARAKIVNELSAAGVHSPADLATRCKRTVCRTTATFETASQADQWTLLYMASLGKVAKNSVVSHSQDAEGLIHLDIYSISDR